MATWFELGKGNDGQHRFALKNDGGTLLHSEGYDAKASAQNGIASVQTNAPQAARYERKTAANGRHFFNLKAGNGQVIGTSPLFGDEAAREAAIAATQAGAATAALKDAG
mgnify:CR=1 FL=1